MWCLYLLQKFFTFKNFRMSNTYKNLFVLNLKLATKLETLYLSTDPQAKVKMILKLN